MKFEHHYCNQRQAPVAVPELGSLGNPNFLFSRAHF
jgi:hypothetical protein